MKCQYPNCKAEAAFSLGLADPDAERCFYCGGHIDIRKHEIMIDLLSGDRRCTAITTDGNQCYNSKRFGNICGIHNRRKRRL